MTYSLALPKVFNMTHNLGSSKVCKITHNLDPNKISKMTHNRKIPVVHSINMINLSPKELQAVAKVRGIKGYKSMSEYELLSALTSSKPVKKGKKPKTNFSKARIEKIRKEFSESSHKFSKSKINEIRRNLYEIENEKSLFESKIKDIERNLTELEENLSKTKRYYDYDDIEYKGIRNVKDLFDL